MVSKGSKAQPSNLQISKSVPTTTGSGKPTSKDKWQVEMGGCTHFGNIKQTWETYFKLHRYPEWWHEIKAKKKREIGANENTSQAAFVSI